MSRLRILVFSKGKERQLQLDAFKRSLELHGNARALVYALDCASLEPGQFKRDVLGLMGGCKYVMFCVDDTIFLRYFDLESIRNLLDVHKHAIGFSLRLGLNTDYCYMKDRNQELPKFKKIQCGCLKYEWIGADLDFAYPLEISSSVYRRDDIVKLLNKADFHNPNTLEVALHRKRYLLSKPYLLCYPKSVAVSVPWNKVQTQFPNNRCGTLTAESLDKYYKAGKRMDIEAYANFDTNAAHQDLPLMLEGE
jgi:hypothetical protein